MDGPRHNKVTLRYAISEYSKWVAAIWGAIGKHNVEIPEAWDMVGQLQNEMRRWVGEDLLNKEL